MAARRILGAAALGAALGLAAMAAPAAAQSPLEVLQRMEALEVAIQRLTAQVERLEYEQRQEAARADARLSDLEFRATELEGGDPTAAQRGAAPQEPEQPPAPSPSQPADAAAAAQGPAPLGTLRGSVSIPERAAFDAAIRDLDASGPGVGRESIAAFLVAYPDSILAGEAQNLLGRAFAREGRHQEAARSFLAGVRDYGTTPKAAENLLGLAAALTDLGRPAEACATLAELAARFADAAPSLRLEAASQARRAGCP